MQQHFNAIIASFVLLFCTHALWAQFSVEGQLMQRAEFRNGYGKLIAKNQDPAFFIGQRLRLQATYGLKKIILYASAQDIRIWGSTPQLKTTDGFFSIYEAWAEVEIDSFWHVKTGRQELNYDNFRFLGNVDWALQGRAHDFALLKYEKNNLKLHLGGGYNQDGEKLTGNILTVANQYKTAQMVRYENARGNLDFSVLFWNDGRQFTLTDSLNQITRKGVHFMQTFGISALRYRLGKVFTLSGFYYHQTGKNGAGKKINAFDAGIQVSGLFELNPVKARKLRCTLGAEVLSGTATDYTGSAGYSFAPLYGTNHAHNGCMDLFYVGGRNENSAGLADVFLRLRFDFNAKGFVALNTHGFGAAAGVYNNNRQRLPNFLTAETDAVFGYLLNETLSVQSGYSQLFPAATLKTLQQVSNTKSVQNWCYLMLLYRPKMKNRFVGVLH